MPHAILDGIRTHYLVQGSGPHLLMMAPRGFNSTIKSWQAGKWAEMDALNSLARHFTVIAYDRREAGLSGGRVEPLQWTTFARHGKLLLEHLGVEKTWVIGPCMGASVAASFGVSYPEACLGLMLPQPVGGYRWFTRLRGFFDRHIAFVRQSGLQAVRDRANGASFQDEPETGPWASVLSHDAEFAARFVRQDVEEYVSIVSATRDAMFPDSFVSGPPGRDLMALDVPTLVWPGDDPSHATSAAHQLRELLPRVRYWDLHVSKQTAQGQFEQILDFRRAVEAGELVAKAA